MPQDDAGLHYPRSRVPKIISSYTRTDVIDEEESATPDMIRVRDRADRMKLREHRAATRDEKFKMRVFWATLVLLTVGDYLYLPKLIPGLNLPWWGHTAMVVTSTFICVILIIKLRMLRTLRRIVTTAVMLALVLALIALLDIAPRAY